MIAKNYRSNTNWPYFVAITILAFEIEYRFDAKGVKIDKKETRPKNR